MRSGPAGPPERQPAATTGAATAAIVARTGAATDAATGWRRGDLSRRRGNLRGSDGIGRSDDGARLLGRSGNRKLNRSRKLRGLLHRSRLRHGSDRRRDRRGGCRRYGAEWAPTLEPAPASARSRRSAPARCGRSRCAPEAAGSDRSSRQSGACRWCPLPDSPQRRARRATPAHCRGRHRIGMRRRRAARYQAPSHRCRSHRCRSHRRFGERNRLHWVLAGIRRSSARCGGARLP